MKQRYTAYNLVRAIHQLPRDVSYNYVNPRTKGLIRIDNVELPAGPIQIRRWNPTKGETYEKAKVESMSTEMIWRVANAINEGDPINLDRILGGSYNTRSVLEALLASTPEFYSCYPGRIMDIDGHSSIEHGHKHLVWLPNEPHQQGAILKKEVPNMAISEIPLQSVTYDNLILPDSMTLGGDMDIEVVRRHTQIQIALYLIGLQLGFRTWIAQNDKGIIWKEKPLLEQPGIIQSLQSEGMISAYSDAVTSARFIDCIWFKNGKYMPAVMEVEHTTGVTSGLTRMKGLQDAAPSLMTRYVIVAPDDDREKVIEEANRPQFLSLDTRYFAYSSVEELYYLCSHRGLHGVNQEFIDNYLEKVRLG
jgi:type II restriction enzyme